MSKSLIENNLDDIFKKSKSRNAFLISISILSILVFLFIAGIFPLQSQIFKVLFPKTPSSADTSNLGSSLEFDGVNDVAKSINITLTNTYTIEAWVKRLGDQGDYETFLSDTNRNYTKGAFSLYIDGDDVDCNGKTDQFAFYDTGNNIVECSDTTIEVGTWYHLAVTRDGNGVRRLFVNGVLKNTANNTPAPLDSDGVFTIGAAGDHPWEYFKGLVDEVRISATAIYTADFTPTSAPFTPSANTLLLYHFEDNSGQVITDSSGNNNNGVLGSTGGNDENEPVWNTPEPSVPEPTLPPEDNGNDGSGDDHSQDGGSSGDGSNDGSSDGSNSSSTSADLNNNGKVDIFDLSIILRNWNKSGQGDLNNNGRVDVFDLSILLRNWTR